MSKKEFNPKHIILSRKGFDSAAGGDASMIIDLGDGNKVIQPLPIPDPYDVIGGTTYESMKSQIESYKLCQLMKMANIVPKLKAGKSKKKSGREYIENVFFCHRDPDIFSDTENAAFGQIGAAEAHLDKNDVVEGDLFLFFGWYKSYKLEDKKLVRQIKDICDDKHVLYGYLYVDEVYNLAEEEGLQKAYKYYRNHPHYRKQLASNGTIKNNRLYVAPKYIPGSKIPGFGIFKYNDNNESGDKNNKYSLILSKDNMPKSRWKRDKNSFMGQVGKKRTMTYHTNTDKCWPKGEEYFQSVARGQEFVIDCSGDKNKDFRQYIYDFIANNIK